MKALSILDLQKLMPGDWKMSISSNSIVFWHRNENLTNDWSIEYKIYLDKFNLFDNFDMYSLKAVKPNVSLKSALRFYKRQSKNLNNFK